MEEHPTHHKKDSNEGLYAIAIGMVISVLILSGTLLYAAGGINSNLQQINTNLANLEINVQGGGTQLQPTATVAPTATPQQQPTGPNIKLEGLVVKGDPDAPITIVEYSDFQCPFCKRFFDNTLPSIMQDWIDEGKAKLYYKHFPLNQIHPQAQKAAEAAECALDQDKFWEMHDKIFENQGAIGVADLKKYAEESGLDAEQFNECLDGGAKAAIVNEHLQEGIANGVTGTPSFFVNGQNIVGARPYEVFQQVLQQYA